MQIDVFVFFQPWQFALFDLNREWEEEKGKGAVVN